MWLTGSEAGVGSSCQKVGSEMEVRGVVKRLRGGGR